MNAVTFTHPALGHGTAAKRACWSALSPSDHFPFVRQPHHRRTPSVARDTALSGKARNHAPEYAANSPKHDREAHKTFAHLDHHGRANPVAVPPMRCRVAASCQPGNLRLEALRLPRCRPCPYHNAPSPRCASSDSNVHAQGVPVGIGSCAEAHPTTQTKINMNDTATSSPNPLTTSPGKAETQWRKASIPLENEVFCQISSKLRELSMQLGYEVPMSKFLRRTVVENWKVQLERYHKRPPR